MSNADSIKARLKNLAIENGKSFQEMLIAYGLERTIYRLSKSPYVENFTLKGGIFLYAMFEGNYPRATTDIDFLAEQISNDENELKEVFADIFRIEVDDPLQFNLKTLSAERITEFKDYHGVHISIVAFLDKTRIPIAIDIGFGDVVYPERALIEYPTVLSEERPKIYGYSLLSSIAEKFEAIVSLAYDNSRFKDFYDIYVLAHLYDFSGKELQEAVRETFSNRKTELNDIVAFEEDFAKDAIRQSRWNAFIRKKKPLDPVTLEETLRVLKRFLLPILEWNQGKHNHYEIWDHDKLVWKTNSESLDGRKKDLLV